MRHHCFITAVILFCATGLLSFSDVYACTGIRLKGADGSVVVARTMEWGAFDLHSRISIIPRGTAFVGHTPNGQPGLEWKAKYGVVGLDGVEKDIILDGMNETGLVVGVFYHPGFAKYAEYDPAKASDTIGPTDVAQFVLTQSSTIKETRKLFENVRVVPVVEPALGFPAPIHIMVTEPSGKSIVVEFIDGKTVIFDNPLGVITNAPTFAWHLTNLRNYVNLSAVALPGKRIEDLDFKPLGAGSGFIGLPGDFTPPSRFVRAVAFTQTTRPLKDSTETVYEALRILDNFNLPLGSAEGSEEKPAKNADVMRSSTIWTTAWDTKNRILYYHTQHNRRVRKVDISKIDFDSLDKQIRYPLDRKKSQDIEDVTPTIGGSSK